MNMLTHTLYRKFSDPKNNQPIIGLLLIAFSLIILPFIVSSGGDSWLRILNIALLYIMLALGLNIVVGFAGLLDLGYIAFFAVGAYIYSLLASPHLIENFSWVAQHFPNGLKTPIWLVLPIAALIAALFGVLLGAPTLKLRGDYLAIVTLGFGEIIRILLTNLNAPINLTNGPQGINMIEPATLFGVNFSKNIQFNGLEFPNLILYYYLFLFLVLIMIVVCVRLEDSKIGRAWTAVRDDETAAQAMGINTHHIKLLAFALGASFAGISGALFASFQGFISPESFGLMESIVVLCMIVLGGMGHIPGVILGAILLAGFPDVLRNTVLPLQQFLFGETVIDAEVLRSLIYGLTLVIIMLYCPKGLWPKNSGGFNGVKNTHER